MHLSDHFTLEELCKSHTAERLGIDNMVDPDSDDGRHVVANLRRVCERILEPVRARFDVPFAPNSGYRCLELNRALKSSDRSQHVAGQAVDIEVPRVSNFDLAVWIRDNLDFDQLILEFYTPGEPSSGWVHCSLAEDGNRGEVRTIGKQGRSEGLVK